jgi:tyrosine-protein phosphatase non-receptor type 23
MSISIMNLRMMIISYFYFFQVIFDREIQKHKKLEEVIQQNLTAQDNILRALTDANVRYAHIRRKVADIAAR